MKNTELTSIDTSMDQQLRILNLLKNLVKESQDKDIQKGITDAEMTQLNNYIDDMVMASTTAKKLAKNIKEALDTKEKAKKATEEKAKTATVKKTKEEDSAKVAESEDDDLDFLN